MTNMDLRQKAWRFAVTRHQGQVYPTTDLPYTFHIGAVLIELSGGLGSGADRDLAMACACLHDILEDTPTRYDEIAEKFGLSVADGVLALTKNRDMHSRAGRLRDSIERIRQQPRAVWAVKLADRIANLEALPKVWTRWRCMHYVASSRLILRELGGASSFLAQRLAGKIRMWESAVNKQARETESR